MILFEEKRRQQKFYSTFSFYLEAEAESAWFPLPHKLRTTLYIFPSLPASPFRLPYPPLPSLSSRHGTLSRCLSISVES